MVSAEPVLPGVYRRQDGGFVVRGSAKDPRTGKLTQVFRVLEDETDPKMAMAWLTRERVQIRDGGAGATAACLRHFHAFAAQLMEEKIRSGELASQSTKETPERDLAPRLPPLDRTPPEAPSARGADGRTRRSAWRTDSGASHSRSSRRRSFGSSLRAEMMRIVSSS